MGAGRSPSVKQSATNMTPVILICLFITTSVKLNCCPKPVTHDCPGKPQPSNALAPPSRGAAARHSVNRSIMVSDGGYSCSCAAGTYMTSVTKHCDGCHTCNVTCCCIHPRLMFKRARISKTSWARSFVKSGKRSTCRKVGCSTGWL